ERYVQACLACLANRGLGEVAGNGLIEAMNKLDLADPATRAGRASRASRDRHSVALSAVTGEGCEALLATIDRGLQSDIRPVRLDVPLTDGKTLAWIYRHGDVLGRRDDTASAHLSVRLSEADIARVRHPQRP